MKKFFWTLAILICLLPILVVSFFLSSNIKMLEPQEELNLKEGKSFWQWDSTHGPINIHYIEKGEGSNHLFLIHGFRSHVYTWRALIKPLADAGYHVWAIDLIGYGLSDKPAHPPYNPDFFIEQIQVFMEEKGIDQAHFVGNSMGGGLALCMALDYPERVKSLVLISALGYPLELPFYHRIGKSLNRLWARIAGPSIVRYGLEQIVYDKKQITDETVEAYCLPYRMQGGISAAIATLRNFDNNRLFTMSSQYALLPHQTLIIWGTHDKLIPLTHYEKFLQDFPSAERKLIECCGHIPQEETPEQVINAILPFLENNNSPNAKE